jgi:sec-independent protein translocase protein TatA
MAAPTERIDVPIQTSLILGIPGGYEWLILLVLVLIFFGNRIPGLARSLGSGITEFKTGLREGDIKPKDQLAEGGKTETKSDGET